ncbi:hypothetical protein OAO87_04595 [bacterium]|nr:hypothetical protein [bacterium]
MASSESPSPARLGRCLGSAERVGGGEAWKVAMRFGCRGLPLDVDLQCVWRMRVVSLNVALVP